MAADAEGIAPREGGLLAMLDLRDAKRALHALFVVLLVLAGLALATVVVPRAFGYGTLAVLSGSMGSSAPTGSLVIASWHSAGEIKTGDVILARRVGRAPVLHRVISREDDEGRPVVRLKGDANPAPDPEPYKLPDRVLRKEQAIPLVGYLVGLVRVPAIWILLVGLPTLYLAFSILRDVWWTPDETLVDEAAPAPAIQTADVIPAEPVLEPHAADRGIGHREVELARAEAILAARVAEVERAEAAVRERLHALQVHERAHAAAAERTEAALRDRLNALEAREAAHAAAVAEPAPAPEAAPETPRAHLRFVPGATGYALVERDEPPPPVDEIVEESGCAYRVTRLGHSPFPADDRQCAYLQQL